MYVWNTILNIIGIPTKNCWNKQLLKIKNSAESIDKSYPIAFLLEEDPMSGYPIEWQIHWNPGDTMI